MLVEFPRTPTGALKRHITDEADARLAFYLPFPADQPPIPDAPPRPQLPQDVVDAPLIRLYNFLRMSLLLFYQPPPSYLWLQKSCLCHINLKFFGIRYTSQLCGTLKTEISCRLNA